MPVFRVIERVETVEKGGVTETSMVHHAEVATAEEAIILADKVGEEARIEFFDGVKVCHFTRGHYTQSDYHREGRIIPEWHGLLEHLETTIGAQHKRTTTRRKPIKRKKASRKKARALVISASRVSASISNRGRTI